MSATQQLLSQVLRLSELTFSPPTPSFCCSPTPSTPPATGIFSPLMDGAMSEFQLRKLKRLVLKPENDSDKAAFYYSIYHSILHGDILPPHLTVLFDLSFSSSMPLLFLCDP